MRTLFEATDETIQTSPGEDYKVEQKIILILDSVLSVSLSINLSITTAALQPAPPIVVSLLLSSAALFEVRYILLKPNYISL